MATYPNEVWPGDADVEALDGTVDAATGLPYIAKGTGPTSTPSYEVQYNRREQRLNRILAAWRRGMVVDEGGLAIGVYPITYTIGGSRTVFAGASGVGVPDNTSRVVYLDSTGQLRVEVTWPGDPRTYLPLASVVSTSGRLAIVDERVAAAFHVPSLEASLVNDREMISASKANVSANQADVQIFAFEAPRNMTLESVQVYCTAVSVSASVAVKVAGASAVSAAVPSSGAIVKPALAFTEITSSDIVTVHVTTDGTGSIADLAVTITVKAPPAI